MTRLLDNILQEPDELLHSLGYALGPGRMALRSAAQQMRDATRVYITGIGSSWHAGMAVQSLLDSAGFAAQLYDASELLHFVPLAPGAVLEGDADEVPHLDERLFGDLREQLHRVRPEPAPAVPKVIRVGEGMTPKELAEKIGGLPGSNVFNLEQSTAHVSPDDMTCSLEPGSGQLSWAMYQFTDLLPEERIDGIFYNHVPAGLGTTVRPGDRVAFVPLGTPASHPACRAGRQQ